MNLRSQGDLFVYLYFGFMMRVMANWRSGMDFSFKEVAYRITFSISLGAKCEVKISEVD